jgi:hypothetical protein
MKTFRLLPDSAHTIAQSLKILELPGRERPDFGSLKE